MAAFSPRPVAGSAGRGSRAGNDSRGARRWTAAGREELESLELHLEHAVAEVSVPHAGILLGRTNASRGYRLPGYGVVFVLTPSALPGGERAVFVFRGRPPGAPRITRSSVHAHGRTGRGRHGNRRSRSSSGAGADPAARRGGPASRRRRGPRAHRPGCADPPRNPEPACPSSRDESTVVRVERRTGSSVDPDPTRCPSHETPPPWSFWFGSETSELRKVAPRIAWCEDVRGAC